MINQALAYLQEVSFAMPWVLLFLLAPLVVFFVLPAAQKNTLALKVPFFSKVKEANQTLSTSISSTNIWRIFLLSLIWILLVISAAAPERISAEISVPAQARDLLLAVDISASMEMADMKIQGDNYSRFAVVKFVVGDFIEKRKQDRIGLVLFGTRAYLQAPLTFDTKTVNQLLQEAQLGFAGEKTAIGDAIGLGVKRLQQLDSEEKVMILLTDGQNTAGEVEPRKAADLAAEAGVKIYTIGVGADEMIQSSGFFGGFNRRINPSADLDEAGLTYIAETTGGRYFRAKNPDELNQIYDLIDQLEANEQEPEVFRKVESLYFWPLGLGIALSFLLALWTGLRPYLSMPNTEQSA